MGVVGTGGRRHRRHRWRRKSNLSIPTTNAVIPPKICPTAGLGVESPRRLPPSATAPSRWPQRVLFDDLASERVASEGLPGPRFRRPTTHHASRRRRTMTPPTTTNPEPAPRGALTRRGFLAPPPPPRPRSPPGPPSGRTRTPRWRAPSKTLPRRARSTRPTGGRCADSSMCSTDDLHEQRHPRTLAAGRARHAGAGRARGLRGSAKRLPVRRSGSRARATRRVPRGRHLGDLAGPQHHRGECASSPWGSTGARATRSS